MTGSGVGRLFGRGCRTRGRRAAGDDGCAASHAARVGRGDGEEVGMCPLEVEEVPAADADRVGAEAGGGEPHEE